MFSISHIHLLYDIDYVDMSQCRGCIWMQEKRRSIQQRMDEVARLKSVAQQQPPPPPEEPAPLEIPEGADRGVIDACRRQVRDWMEPLGLSRMGRFPSKFGAKTGR